MLDLGFRALGSGSWVQGVGSRADCFMWRASELGVALPVSIFVRLCFMREQLCGFEIRV